MTRNERIALYTSLALNLFFLGVATVVIFGLLLHGPRFNHRDRFPPHPGNGYLAKIMPESARERLEPELAPKRASARAAFDDARVARRAAIEALAAKPYSPDAAAAAFARAREADLKAVSTAQELMTAAMLSLNDDERQEVYQKLSRFIDRTGKPRPGDEDGPPVMMDGPGHGPPPDDGGPPPPPPFP